MKRKKTTLVASVACGVLCAVCVIAYLQSVRGEAEAARAEALARYGGEQLEVCVATRDLPAGQKIEPGDVELKMWVADLLPEDAARTLEEVEGRAPTSPIMAGEVVVLKRFEGTQTSLDVPEGYAALSVPAEDVQAVGGSLSVGATADLYSVGGTSTTLLAQDVSVLATSATGSEGAGAELSWVTLAVEPESVQEVIDASQRSELYFALPASSAENDPTSDGDAPASGSDEPEPRGAASESAPGDESASGDGDAAQGSDASETDEGAGEEGARSSDRGGSR